MRLAEEKNYVKEMNRLEHARKSLLSEFEYKRLMLGLIDVRRSMEIAGHDPGNVEDVIEEIREFYRRYR